MITSASWGRRSLFQVDRWAKLLIEMLYHYRGSAYLLHGFVVMPDHIHVMFTPTTSLEKAVQFIKGGFSYRAKKDLGSNMEVWQKGFSDYRIRDAGDYLQHVSYIQQNPVRKHLCERAEAYPYSSAYPGFDLDRVPQGLKPALEEGPYGAAEAAPFQSTPSQSTLFQSTPDQGAPDQRNPDQGAPDQSNLDRRPAGRAEAARIEDKSGKIAS
jgi:putative transposase